MLNCEHCLTVLGRGTLQIELVQKLQNRPRASSRPRAINDGQTLVSFQIGRNKNHLFSDRITGEKGTQPQHSFSNNTCIKVSYNK